MHLTVFNFCSVSESSSSFLTSDNDPSLASFEQMDQTNSADDSNLDSLRTSSVAGPSSSSTSSRVNYTSKDYADASLLVDYSKRAAASGANATPVLPSPRSARRSGNVLPQQMGYQNESGYPVGPCYPSTPGSLCEPYVPQLATIDTIRSQQVQYTVAKTWHEDAPPVITLTHAHDQSQQPNRRRMSDNEIRSNMKFRNDQHQQLVQQSSLNFDASTKQSAMNFDSSAKQCRNAPITESLLKINNPKSRRPPKKKDLNDVKILPNANQTKTTDRSSRSSTSNCETVVVGKHLEINSTPSFHFSQPSGISVNCDNITNEPLLSYNSTSSQNSNVLRPIPISFGRTDQSAFSPLSPTGSFAHNTNVQSPMQQQQRSPSSTASANDLYRNIGGETPTPSTTLVHMTSAAGPVSAVSAS